MNDKDHYRERKIAKRSEDVFREATSFGDITIAIYMSPNEVASLRWTSSRRKLSGLRRPKLAINSFIEIFFSA
jgi:hypothetical protein